MAATVDARDVIGEATLGELEATLRGGLVRPADPDYDQARAVWNAAHDRRPADHPLRRRRRRHAGGRVRPQRGPGGGGPRRRPQHRRVLHLRRRGCHRHLADAGHPRRGRPACRRPARAHLVDLRPRDPGVRPGRHRRPGVQHRHRRVHPRRRVRLAAAQVRPDLRQPALGGRGHRRRPARHRQRAGHPTCCGRFAAAAAATSGW